MAEPDKRQIGDGSDNYGEAAKQMAKAAKEAGIETAKQAAVKGAEAGANAAAATVQAGVEGGKAVAEIAAGTAAGGPWGAILSAAWAMRHTLFKILVCICLFFLVIIVLIVSLPSVVTNSVFGLDGSMVDMENPTTLLESYNHLAADISAVVEEGYDAALAKVEQIIEDGGYDYDLSMDALINYAQGSAGYDVSYILAAYSASLQQRNTGKEDMLAKLRSVADSMFPVAFVEKESEQIVPFTYATYRPVTVTVVTSKTQTGTINGVPQYRYTTARRTYYEPDETITTSEPVNVAAYTPVVVSVPIYSGGRITGTRSETYYEQDGNETLTPETEVVKYVECTIQPFDNSVIIRAFGIDPSATYDQFKITYGEAIQKMANALKMTLYGTLGNGQMVPLTDAELIAFVNAQSCSPMRKHILTTALSLVGKVPYFWGGKSAPGWNDAWNTPRLVTSAGSPTTGTIRPFGLDCSGFTTWVFNTAVGVEIGAGCNGQYPNTYGISAAELLPGDLGFLADDDGWGHVLIFAGYDAEGTRMWVHSSGGIGVILNTPSYEGRLSYRRLSIVDYDAPVVNSPNGEALYTLEVEVTHFWDNGEANLLKALVLYIDLDRSRSPETKNLAAAYRLLTQNSERQLMALFEKLPLDHPARAPFNLFSQASDTVRSGIVLGLGTRLQVLQNEAVRDIISRSDIDLTAPGKRKCAYFVILSDQDATMAFLSSLFFSFLFIKLVRYADSTPELRCKVPVNLIFDEFNNVGKLGGAADGSDFARTLSVIRSRAIYVMLAVQSLGQLQNRYPNNLWAEIVGNLDVQLMLGCTDEVSAEYFSARSGDMSVEINSTMTVRKTIAVAQVIPQYRQTEGQGRRRLLTPDEVLRIPNEELLVVIRGHNVLKLKKFDYADHPLSKELTPVSILDYTPPHAAAPFLQTETTSPRTVSEERPHTPSIPSKRRTLYSSAKPPSEF